MGGRAEAEAPPEIFISCFSIYLSERYMPGLRDKIIKVLASEGALSIYAIKKKANASYSSCFMVMKDLEAKGLVRLKEVSAGSRGGVAKVYIITLEGLAEAVRAGWRGEGAENLADLDPAVFGVWGRLVKIAPEEEVRVALMHAVRACAGLRGEEAVKAFREAFYTIPFTCRNFSRDAWLKAIKSDDDLRKLVISILRGVEERLSSCLDSIIEIIWFLKAS